MKEIQGLIQVIVGGICSVRPVPLIFFALLQLLVSSCENKELYRCDEDASGPVVVRVVFHWPEDASRESIPTSMRLHLYPVSGGRPFMADLPSRDGGTLRTQAGAAWHPVCFDYRGPLTLDFRDEFQRLGFEVYNDTLPGIVLPQVPPPVVAEADPASFFAGFNGEAFAVPAGTQPGDTVVLHMYPVQALRTFTFLLVDVTAVSGIADIRGFFGGMPGGYFPATGGAAPGPASRAAKRAANQVEKCPCPPSWMRTGPGKGPAILGGSFARSFAAAWIAPEGLSKSAAPSRVSRW